MRIIVSGANGVVGQALLRHMAASGQEVVALVRSASASAELAGSGVELVELDLASFSSTSCLPARADAVVHLAQGRRYREFPTAANEVFQINTAATVRLAEYAVGAGVTNFIYASTGTVYEKQARPVAESDPTQSADFYSATKLSAEKLLGPFAGLMHVFMPRLFYVYGPAQQNMLVSNLAATIQEGRTITLQGPTGIDIAPVYSGDVAAVLATALKEDWAGVWNVGGNKVVSLRELASHIGRAIGHEPVLEQVADQTPPSLLPDLAKLGGRFDLDSFLPLEAGLAQMFSGRPGSR